MYLEELVGVAVGLILAYIMISMAVMSLQEVISGWMNKRARNLETILREMLAETLKPPARGITRGETPIPENLSGITEKLYNHSLIKSLYQGITKPSYIPRDKFVLALFDIIINAGTDASTIEKALTQFKIYQENFPAAVQAGLDTAVDELLKKAREVKDDPVKLAELHAELDKLVKKFADYDIGPVFDALLQAQLPTEEDEVVKALKRGSATLIAQNPQLKKTLDDLLYMAELYARQGESILAKARTNAEKWFDDTMDRASGWYKRTAQKWAFTIGLILALAFNIDTVEIATRLWIQPALRESLIRAAESYKLPEIGVQPQGQTPNPIDTINQLKGSLVGLQLPVGWNFVALGPDEFNPATDLCTILSRPSVQRTQGKVVYGLSINGTCTRLSNPPQGWGYFTKGVGFLITALAAMQGAPFWFEILKKIVNVRSTGIKPEEKEERS